MLVVGDVNSTVACSLVASKIEYTWSGPGRIRPLIGHVEAGLRSFDRSMPEELNRILTDSLSDLLFVSESSGVENLVREGVPKKKIHLVGNTMVDTLLKHRARAMESRILSDLGLCQDASCLIQPDCRQTGRSTHQHQGCRDYAVVTLHRPSNVDHRSTFLSIVKALREIARKLPVFFPVHPRTAKQIREFSLENYFTQAGESLKTGPEDSRIHSIEALGYLDFLCLMSRARLILTDSGGIQEETTVLGIPCVTLRHNT